MDFLLDKTTNDLAVGNRDLQLVSEGDEIAQRLNIKLKIYQGEWFRDINYGIPWYQILSQSGNKEIIDNYIKAMILSDPDVESISKYTSVKDGTLLKVSVIIKSKTGNVGTIFLEV